MKTANLLLITLSLFASAANGSVLAILTVKQPLYLAGSGGGDEILIRDVQIVSLHADPEATFSAIVVPYTPAVFPVW